MHVCGGCETTPMSNASVLRRGGISASIVIGWRPPKIQVDAMGNIKVIAVAFTLLAVVANPILARSMPCCCSRGGSEPSCCLEETDSGDCCTTTGGDTSGCRRGCCCRIKAPPATMPSQVSSAKTDGKDQPAAFATLPPVDFAALVPACRYLDHSPKRFSPSGPPLLALYCIWRK